MDIDKLRRQIRADKYEISLHAQKESCEEELSISDIEQAIVNGEILERYPEDKRGTSCLVLGYSISKPIHVVCAILPNDWIRIITVYIPKKPKWTNPRQRRR